MKKLICLLALALGFSVQASAQSVKQIPLESIREEPTEAL